MSERHGPNRLTFLSILRIDRADAGLSGVVELVVFGTVEPSTRLIHSLQRGECGQCNDDADPLRIFEDGFDMGDVDFQAVGAEFPLCRIDISEIARQRLVVDFSHFEFLEVGQLKMLVLKSLQEIYLIFNLILL